MPRISLCLIAKNEEAMIVDCLESVRGVVDEMIVVDTGSLDRTVELAEAAGARVVRFEWCDDFSAARNASLKAATGDWLLVLDADERLGPDQGAAIRAAVESDALDCGLLPLHNASDMTATLEDVLSGAARKDEPILLPRLLRRTPDLAWSGHIHEDVTEWITAGKRRIRRVDASIVHYGYVPSIWESRNKSERNLRMLEKQVALTPDRPTYRSYLAREQMRAGDNAAAWETIEAGWESLTAVCAAGGVRPAGVSLASLRAFFQLQNKDYQSAIETCEATRAMGFDHPNLKLFLGAAHEQLALATDIPEATDIHLEAAAEAYEGALADKGRIFAEEVSPGATSWAAGVRLGTIRLLQKRFEDALWTFETVYAVKPGYIDALLGRAEALIEVGEPEEAIRSLEPLMVEERPDPWLLAGLACEATGNFDEHGILIKRAAQLAEKGFISHHRRPVMYEQAVLCGLYKSAIGEAPSEWTAVAALLARQPAPTIERRPAADKLRRLITKLLRSNRVDLLETLLEPRGEQLLPGITALVYEVLAEFGITPEDDGEPNYVFIGGAGRSGTTLFRAMLAAHPRFHCGPEAKLVPAMCSLREQWWTAMGRDLTAAGVDESILDNATRAFLDALMKGLGGDAPRIAEKTPHNVIHTRTLGRLFPRARFIHVVRDGRAVAASLLQQNWINPSTGQRLEYCQDAGAAARYWSEVVSVARDQAASVPGRYLEVRYEDLVQRPRAVMEAVMAWLGEPWDEAVLRHQDAGVSVSMLESSTSQISRAVHTRAMEKWRENLSKAQQDQVVSVAGPLLYQLRYIDPAAELAVALAV